MIAQGASRLPLAWRIFLLAGLLVVLSTGGAVLLAWWVDVRVASQAMDTSLAKATEAQSSLIQQRLRLLERTALMLSRDPALRQRGATPADADTAGAGSDALRSALQAAQREFGFDLALVFDAGLATLASSSGATAPDPSADVALEGEALLLAARDKAQLQSGSWRRGERLYQAAVVPLPGDGREVALLLLAQQVDEALARDIARASDAGIAFWLPTPEGPVLAASALAEGTASALTRALSERPDVVQAIQLGQPIDRLALEFGGQHWQLRLRPLAAEGGRGLGLMSALSSPAHAGTGFPLFRDVAWIAAVLWLLLAVPASFWLARRILHPTRRLAQVAEQAAAGNYRDPVEVADRNELARVGRAFDSLLLELREKREVEEYVARYSRFLPEAGEAAGHDTFPSTPEPKWLSGWLLGVEYVPETVGGEGLPALTGVLEAQRRMQQLAARFDGRVLAGSGQRWVIGFEGREYPKQALQAARSMLEAEPPEGLRTAALAITDGDVVFASPSTGAGLLGGAAVAQLDRLLAESAPGQVLLSRGVADRLKSDYGTTLLSVCNGGQSGRRFFALHAAGLDALGWAAADPASALPGAAALAVPLAARRIERGTRIGGRYGILSTLGEGRSGVVYKARDLELRDIVALRLLRPGSMPGRELARLQETLRAVRRIAHPNVLRVFDFGTVEGVPFISGEYVRGVGLDALLAESGRVPYAAGLRIARQFCAGLAAAHEVGVLHRDLKPGNLILDTGGNTRLMDAGLAPPLARPGSNQGQGANTAPWYCPPEQLAGEELDVRSDIYAAGAVICELFCGGLPYPGPGAAEVYRQQMQGEPLRPSSLWSGVPPALEEIILRCVARERDARYRSVAELGADLAQLRA